jgi:hypothetical protein
VCVSPIEQESRRRDAYVLVSTRIETWGARGRTEEALLKGQEPECERESARARERERELD